MGIALNAIRDIVTFVTKSPKMFGFTEEGADFYGREASDLLKRELLADKPSMICRFGTTELNCVIGYCNPPSLKNYVRFFKSEISCVGWSNNTIMNVSKNAGLFSPTPATLKRFSELMLDDMQYIDVLGTCIRQELYFSERLKHVKKIPMKDMEPFYHEDPWSKVLEGKKVLVIHPFEHSIKAQYEKRHLLFGKSQILPPFELRTIKAVQSIGNNAEGFESWFDALDYMKEKINKCDFDIAILGCGAYGVPLAAHIKRIGKKAIHMGGAVQLLFGIKGARWEDREFYRQMFNSHWIRPLPEDRPMAFREVENGCYW